MAKNILQKQKRKRVNLNLLLSHTDSLAAPVVMFVFVLTQVNFRKLDVVGVLLEMRAVAYKKLLLRTQVYP